MVDKRISRWFLSAVLMASVPGTVVPQPAQAQFWGGNSNSGGFFGGESRPRPRPQQRNGGFFNDLFGAPRQVDPSLYERDRPSNGGGGGGGGNTAESARAPAARKPDKDAPAPTTSVVVMGDGMADWLAYGLEEAFGEVPEIGIVRKNRINSGLIHYDQRSDLDWWRVAREQLAPEKPNYVIMMLGVADRQSIRERDLAKEAEKKEAEKKARDDAAKKAVADKPASEKKDGDKSAETKPATDKPAASAAPDQTAQAPADAEGGDDSSIVAPEPVRGGRRANGMLEFRSDEWAAVYTRRIDDTIAALKSKGAPVFWVGLPAIRGAKSTSDVVYLNDLFRARAEKAGITFIDVWDGFVDEGGKFTQFGPDYEGQDRRLRSGDGVYFTKYGARKLAHYVEREIRRTINNRAPIALPAGPMGPVPIESKTAARPLAGPVVALTAIPENSETLAGTGASNAAQDAVATQVLVKGEAIAAPRGRADDFAWASAEGTTPAPVATTPMVRAVNSPAQATLTPVPPQDAAVATETPATVPLIDADPDARPAVKPAQKPAAAKPSQRRAEDQAPRPRQAVQQRQADQRPPPQQQRRDSGPFGNGGPFGWIR